MPKDVRYKGIKSLIESGHIQEFSQIFEHIPKTVVARDLRKNTGRMDDLIKYCERLTYLDILHLSRLIEVEFAVISQLIHIQYTARKSQEPTEKKKSKPLNNSIKTK